MRTFIIIWLGQLISAIGSKMTTFAIGVWIWELTESATTVALLGLAMQVPRVISSLYAGILVDRYSRKKLMMLSDAVAAISTIVLVMLYFSGHLAIWHLYLTGAINSCFGQVQGLAYQGAIALIVPKDQYTRATSMGSFFHYGSAIIAPASAGALYPVIGLGGIFAVDLITFTIGILTLAGQDIPQPLPEAKPGKSESFQEKLSFGFRYLRKSPSFVTLLITTSLFWLFHDLGGAIFAPLILARTDNNSQILGQVFAMAGVGGVLSGTLISIRGGLKNRIQGLLSGMMGAGFCKIIFGLATTPWVWLPAQFCSSLNFPLMTSTNASIWIEKIPTEIQGRIFSVRLLSRQLVSAIALAVAGPLTDLVFIPAMRSNGMLNPFLRGIFGTGDGAGIALLYVLTSIALLMVGLVGYFLPSLQEVDISQN